MGRVASWVARALAVALLAGCSSGDPATGGSPDAALVPDVGAPDLPADDLATDDAPIDARQGTERGGPGGNRDASGEHDDSAPADAPGGAEVLPPGLPNDTCATAQPFVLDRPRVDLIASTRGARHDLDLGCGAPGGEVFFSFSLAQQELVYADSFGGGFDTVLAFVADCGGAPGGVPAVFSCGDDACGTKQSQVVAVLDVGRHYLVVSGPGAGGDVAIHIEHAPVGTGSVASLGAGSTTSTGTTTGTGGLGLCEAGGPENAYWWTSCPDFVGGAFSASTCTGTAYDTLLSLQIPRADMVLCNDDTCSYQSLINAALPPGAGVHVLAVDGFSVRKLGPYTLTTVRP
jgi:hypothetical protein